VRGAQQMTLRVFGKPPAPGPEPVGGPGTRYLHRARGRRVAELDGIRERLAPFVVAEKLATSERPRASATTTLLATLYHLVKTTRATQYLEGVAAARDVAGPLTLRATGPFPPYAFAAEGLA
jgi:hypothetical protein